MNPENFILSLRGSVSRKYQTKGDQVTYFLCKGVVSLRASSPIWASEASLARTRERAAKPRGAGERRACNHPLQIFICTSPRRREIPLAEK